MNNLKAKSFLYQIIILLVFLNTETFSQTYDTISNWDGIVQNWYVSSSGSEVISNPSPDEINMSEHCIKVVTTNGMWDHMSYNLTEPVNFDSFPRYRLKVLAPSTGGDVTLKFENSDNTLSYEIVKSAVPGQWADLEYDFSGIFFNNLTKMVIFFDFRGSTAGMNWYFDDILKEIPGPLVLESNLPIVVINTFGVSIPDEPKIEGHMGIIHNGINVTNHLNDPFNNYNGSIGIEVRGQSTQMFPKKSYAFETRDNAGENLNVSLLGMPEENDWILYAPYTDKSMLRNVVTYEIGHKMGGYCTRTIFCELVVNNDYKGVYILMEKIKKDENRVDIATLNPDEVSGNDLTGGYILRVDKIDPDFVYDTDGWLSNPIPPYPNAMDITFQYYYPESDVIASEQKTYIKNYITTAENILISPGFTNPEDGYQKYFDLPSFVDFMLLNEVSKEVDKYRYSSYFFKEKDSDGGKLFAGPIWDFNLGYGNVDYWPPGIDYRGWVYTDVQTYSYSIIFWWKRLMEDAYFRDLAKTRWVDLRQTILKDAEIHTAIDSILTHIDEAKDRNYERWPILGQYVWPNYDWYNNTYVDEVDYFESFLFNRLGWMDYNLPGSVLSPGAGISSEANNINVKLYGDYFRNKILKKKYFRLNDVPIGITVQSVSFKNSSECTLILSDNASGFPEISVTIDEEILNTWEDITSNKLESAGFNDSDDPQSILRIYESDNQLFIHCEDPEILPSQINILNLTGQHIVSFDLNNSIINILPHQLKAGIYLVLFETAKGTQVKRFLIH